MEKVKRFSTNIHMVYSFLSKDYHQVGYDDALVYPDSSYRSEKVLEIQGDLEIVILKSRTYYEDAIKELEFLIASRNRLGMVDVVDELKIEKRKKPMIIIKRSLELHKEVMDQGGISPVDNKLLEGFSKWYGCHCNS